MKRTEYTKTEVNAAIFTVLKEQFKKNCKEAHKIVEAAGYTIQKNNGHYEVFNTETKRWIWLQDGYRCTYIYHGAYMNQKAKLTNWNDCKFDFVGCLDKPQNRDYYTEPACNVSKAHANGNDLRWKKSYIKSDEEALQRIQEQMQTLQRELIRVTERKVRHEQELKDFRVKLGLA